MARKLVKFWDDSGLAFASVVNVPRFSGLQKETFGGGSESVEKEVAKLLEWFVELGEGESSLKIPSPRQLARKPQHTVRMRVSLGADHFLVFWRLVMGLVPTPFFRMTDAKSCMKEFKLKVGNIA